MVRPLLKPKSNQMDDAIAVKNFKLKGEAEMLVTVM